METLQELFFDVLNRGFKLVCVDCPNPTDDNLYNDRYYGFAFKYDKLTAPYINHVEFGIDLSDSPSEDIIHTYTDDYEDEMPCSFKFEDFFIIFMLFNAIRSIRVRFGNETVIAFFEWAKTQLKPMQKGGTKNGNE